MKPPRYHRKRNDKLPSRFLLVIDGLEVFIYNRTVAYDNIMDILEKNNDVSSSEEKRTKSLVCIQTISKWQFEI